MGDDGGKTPSIRRGERRLAIGAAILFTLLLIVSLALWIRHGEEIFFSRIVSAIRGCF